MLVANTMTDSDTKEQLDTAASTPSSQRQDSTGPKATKDRQCPFCDQPFTSSSLGRHLDLYIKPRNPKPPDGVHDVDEIRKLRGGITRRQPKSGSKGSTSKASGWREDGAGSAPNTVSRGSSKPAPRLETMMTDGSSTTSPLNMHKDDVVQTSFNAPNWQATGVINNLPPRVPSRNDNAATPTGQAQRIQEMRRDVTGKKIQRPDHDQEALLKLHEDAEVGRAAELALREVLGSLEAAHRRAQPLQLVEGVDFFALSFPGLCLALLPAPPTLFGTAPFPSHCSWSFDPPGQKQFESVNRNVSDRVQDIRQGDEERFPDSLVFRHSAHVQNAYEHWQLLSAPDRAYAWTLETLRGYTKVKEEKMQTAQELEAAQNRISHLETEYDRLSKCQLPREYLLHPPNTLPAPAAIVKELNNVQLRSGAADVQYDADALLNKWRTTVKATSRRPPPLPSRGAIGDAYPLRRSEKVLEGDMIMNGAVLGVNGAMPRNVDAPFHDPAYVDYETPPNPGAVVGADTDHEGDEDAEGEADEDAIGDPGIYAGRGALTRTRRAVLSAGQSPRANGTLNANGKRTLAHGAASGRAGGPKVYKEQFSDRGRRANNPR